LKMAPKSRSFLVSVWFAAAICAITLIMNLFTYSQGWGPSLGGLIPFLCFLPMAFFFAAIPDRATLEYVKTLEARIERLELEKQGG
jgi:hypothetical protein